MDFGGGLTCSSHAPVKVGTRIDTDPQDGVCKKTIDRQASVESIQWLSDGKCWLFLSFVDITDHQPTSFHLG